MKMKGLAHGWGYMGNFHQGYPRDSLKSLYSPALAGPSLRAFKPPSIQASQLFAERHQQQMLIAVNIAIKQGCPSWL
jgi:hypothetical protein